MILFYAFERIDPDLGTAVFASVDSPKLSSYLLTLKFRQVVPTDRTTSVGLIHDHHPLSMAESLCLNGSFARISRC